MQYSNNQLIFNQLHFIFNTMHDLDDTNDQKNQLPYNMSTLNT